MSSFKVKKGDLVVVTTGKSDIKNKTGKVLSVDRSKGRVLVEKVNIVKRQVKPTADRPGATVEKEAPIHISNVAIYNKKLKKADKVKIYSDEKGKKRIFKSDGKEIK